MLKSVYGHVKTSVQKVSFHYPVFLRDLTMASATWLDFDILQAHFCPSYSAICSLRMRSTKADSDTPRRFRNACNILNCRNIQLIWNVPFAIRCLLSILKPLLLAAHFAWAFGRSMGADNSNPVNILHIRNRSVKTNQRWRGTQILYSQF